MLEAGGRPIISHLLELLAKSGVGEVFMNAHHRADVLTGYCGDGSRWGLHITYAIESELLGTAGALRSFTAHLQDEPFFVAYGDNFFACDPAALWRYHNERAALATLALFEKSDVSGSGIVEVDGQGRVQRFLEKPTSDQVFSRLVNGGLYVLSPDILSELPDKSPCDFGHDVFPALLAAGLPVYGRRMPGQVWPIDTPDLYYELCGRFGG
jgi:NDP-sugar pyrophosphorylase family protein